LFGWFVVGVIKKHLPVIAIGRGFLVCFTQDLIASELINALPIKYQASDDQKCGSCVTVVSVSRCKHKRGVF
jgi:hypothetical protein